MLYPRCKQVLKRSQNQSHSRQIIDLVKKKLKETMFLQENYQQNQHLSSHNKNQDIQNKSVKIAKRSEDDKSVLQTSGLQEIPTNSYLDLSKSKKMQIEKLFDVKVLNEEDNVLKTQNMYISLLEQKNQQLLAQLAESHNRNYRNVGALRQITVSNKESQELRLIRQQLANLISMQNKVTEELEQKKRMIVRLNQFYIKGKNQLCSNSFELIECKNELNCTLSKERVVDKTNSIHRCLARNEQLVQVYRLLIEQNGTVTKKLSPEQTSHRLAESEAIREYQCKIINHYKKQNIGSSPINEIALLRYNVNRISQQNEALIAKLHDSGQCKKRCQQLQEQLKKQKLDNIPQSEMDVVDKQRHKIKIKADKRSNNKTIIPQNTDASFSFSHKIAEESFETCNKYANAPILTANLCQTEAQNYKLKVEKEYLSDALMQKQKQNEQLSNELIQAKADNQLLKESLSLSSSKIQLLNDQIVLLKAKSDKEKNDLTVSPVNNDENVTLEQLLRFLSNKQTKRYQFALIRIVQKYETRISELSSSFILERELRDKLMNWSRLVYSLSQNRENNLLYEQLANQPKLLDKLSQNEIDKVLRQIKCFSIGIDEQQQSKMQDELKDYVVNLQSRMPVLAEVMNEDGSSVAFDTSFRSVNKEQQVEQ